MRRAACLILATLVLAFAAPAAQALENEVLLVTVPKGYKIGFENWTEMVTVQIFLNLRDVTPAQYRARIEKLWADACAGSEFSKVKDGVEYGYPTLTWLQTCPHNAQTGKPELTWMKALQGRDSFYLVQKAYKFEPSAGQRKEWGGFLDSVRICDTRLPERPCRMGQ